MRARLEGRGSGLYALTWKHWATPSGPPICALRALVARTSDSACTGWPSPTTNDHKAAPYGYPRGDHSRPHLLMLGVARLCGWSSPLASDGSRGGDYGLRGNLNMSGVARLCGWNTPTASAAGGTPETFLARKQKHIDKGHKLGLAITSLNIEAQLADSGRMQNGSPVQTRSKGQLNPAHSRWLMGLPKEWDDCAAMVTPSCLRLRQRSLRVC